MDRAPAPRRRFPTWPVLLVVASTLLLGSASLIMPFGRDQGIHAFIADSMLSGKVVYRDVFNVKPPLTTVIHALALLLFGHSMTAIRLLDLLWTLGTALAIFLFCRRALKRDWLAAVAGAFYPFLYYLLGFWYTAQTDGWLNLPLLGALLLALPAGGAWTARPLRWLAAGACIGIAVLIKYTAAALLPLLIVVVLVAQRRAVAQGVRASLGLTLGFVLPLALCSLSLLVSGAMPAFIESEFGLVPAYAMVSKSHGLIARLVDMLRVPGSAPQLRLAAVLFVPGLIAGVFFLARRREWRYGFRLVGALLATAFVSTFSQGKFFVYHYLPFLPVVALVSGLLLYAVLAPLSRRIHKAAGVAIGAVVAAVLFTASGYPALFRDLGSVVSGKQRLHDYWMSSRFNMGQDYSLRDDILLADYLRETTRPADRVFIWGFEPTVNFLARRWTVSRFLYDFPMVIDWNPQRFRDELMNMYVNDPAEVFVVEHNDVTPWASGSEQDSFEALMGFPELRDFIPTRYVRDRSIGRFDVFRLAVMH